MKRNKHLHQVVDSEVVDVGHAAVDGLPDLHRTSGASGKHRARQAVSAVSLSYQSQYHNNIVLHQDGSGSDENANWPGQLEQNISPTLRKPQYPTPSHIAGHVLVFLSLSLPLSLNLSLDIHTPGYTHAKYMSKYVIIAEGPSISSCARLTSRHQRGQRVPHRERTSNAAGGAPNRPGKWHWRSSRIPLALFVPPA